MADQLRDAALDYHRRPRPGKIEVAPTKALATQRDLALAYSPGVAFACEAIVEDPAAAAELTGRGNLVAVITNGTAVLGLGAIGPLAGKPVMEGKGVLFKKFAGIDVFDIEVDERDPAKLADIVASLEPTFGGINLEDIKAPECFEVERLCRQRMKIPVFHDDQHGTAIIVAAGLLNGLQVVGKDIAQVRLVASGAGAAALACLDLLVSLGLDKRNIVVTDIAGVVYEGRSEQMDPYKARYAVDTAARSLGEAIEGADVFLGLSAPGVLKPEMVARMAAKPLIFALANPVPEIMPDAARAVRQDAVIATGRSDFPNQVNNVLCFPFLFRGALDVGATAINEAMKHACAMAIAALAREGGSDIVRAAYGDEPMQFGPDYLIPKPFDPRLILQIAPAVAQAAMDSGVATRPIADMEAYRARLGQFVFRSGMLMRPIFEAARSNPLRLAYAEGADARVLQAAQQVIDDRLAQPVLIGERAAVQAAIAALGLRLRPGDNVALVDPGDNPDLEAHCRAYRETPAGAGRSLDDVRALLRSDATALATVLLRQGQVDAMLCGTVGQFWSHMRHLRDVVGKAEGVGELSTLAALILPQGTFFICDTHFTPEPTAEAIAEMTLLSAAVVRRFGVEPCVALLSHSNFGSRQTASAEKMAQAVTLLRERAPELAVDGEMQADLALSETIRRRVAPGSQLNGQANLLVMPNLDAANITFNSLKSLGGGVSVGPILIGAALPAHVLTRSVTVRGIVNMSALAVAEAQHGAAEQEA